MSLALALKKYNLMAFGSVFLVHFGHSDIIINLVVTKVGVVIKANEINLDNLR